MDVKSSFGANILGPMEADMPKLPSSESPFRRCGGESGFSEAKSRDRDDGKMQGAGSGWIRGLRPEKADPIGLRPVHTGVDSGGLRDYATTRARIC
jgi:hypothetical protein